MKAFGDAFQEFEQTTMHQRHDGSVGSASNAGKSCLARRNAQRHGVLDRLELIRADIFPAQSQKEFSLITSNPPYIAEADMSALQREVRDFEPLAALVSGQDGLDHIRALLREAPRRLSAGGYFIFEIGFGQRDLVAKLIDTEVWNIFQVRNDLQGIPRTFLLQKK